MDEHTESWEEVMEMMNVGREFTSLQDLKDFYGLSAQRIKGIILEFDPSARAEAAASIDRRYPDLKKKRNDHLMRLGLPPEGWERKDRDGRAK